MLLEYDCPSYSKKWKLKLNISVTICVCSHATALVLLYSKNRVHSVKSVQIHIFSGPYFPVFGLNTEKYVPEKTPYLDSFYSVNDINHNMKIKWNNDKNKFSELWKIKSWLTKKHQLNWHLLVQSQQRKHHNNVWNLFKVNNKNIRTTSLTRKCRLRMH